MTPDDPFDDLDDDAYLPPESDVDPEEDLDLDDEPPEADDEEVEEEPEDEGDAGEEPDGEPEDGGGEGPDRGSEEDDEEEEEPREDLGGEPAAEPEPEEGVVRIPPTAGEEDPGTEPGDPWGGIDEEQYLPPESDVDPEEDLDLDDEPGEAGDEPEPAPEADPGAGTPDPEDDGEPEPAGGPDLGEPPGEEGERPRRRPERPPDEDLRIEDVIRGHDEPPASETEAADAGDEDTGEEPLPAGPAQGEGEDEELDGSALVGGPPDPGEDAEADGEPAGEEPDEREGDEPGEVPPPPGAPSGGPERGPPDEPVPDLPGVGAALAAEVLDGFGSRRVAGTILGLALVLVGAAYWPYRQGLSDAGWFLRVAFVLGPTLLLPAFAYRFPAERRTGHDRVLATYPPGPGRFLVGRYLALVLLGLAYLAVALAVAGPVAWYAGPHWVGLLPRHVGVGVLVVLATAGVGVLLGTLLDGVRASAAAGAGLALAILWYLAPRGVYLAEASLEGTGYEVWAVRLLHLSPAVPGTALLTEPDAFPVLAPTMPATWVGVGALLGMALVFLALGSLAYVRLQGPGGWRVHPLVVVLFGVATVAVLASPLALPVDLDRGDPFVERTRASGVDVSVTPAQDLRGADGGRPVDDHLTQGVTYDGFLTLEFFRRDSDANRTLGNVTVDVEAPVLGVDGSHDVGSVTVPASGNGSAEVPVEVGVEVLSVPGAYLPVDATAFVEVTSDEADFAVVVDDLATAASGGPLVRWVPAAVAAGVAAVLAAVLVTARRQV